MTRDPHDPAVVLRQAVDAIDVAEELRALLLELRRGKLPVFHWQLVHSEIVSRTFSAEEVQEGLSTSSRVDPDDTAIVAWLQRRVLVIAYFPFRAPLLISAAKSGPSFAACVHRTTIPTTARVRPPPL
jgi:hypothetical protein